MDLSYYNQILFESEERYKAFIHLSGEGIFRLELEQGGGVDITLSEEEQLRIFFDHVIIAECNDIFAAMYGFSGSEELVGMKLRELLLRSPRSYHSLQDFIRAGYRITDMESTEKDNFGNIKYFLNNLVGIVEGGKLVRAWGTAKDITDLKKASDALMQLNHELNEKNQQLTRINNELDSFIYTVSHDLNSPLSNIDGLLKVMKLNECYQKNDTKVLIDLMEVAVSRFRSTIQNIAELPQLHQKPESERDEVYFEEVLENVQFSIRNLIAETNAKIESSFKVPSIKISNTSVQSVLYNLLSNALKYRHPDRRPHISLSTGHEEEYVTVEVKDNGIGFSPEKSTDVFDMFKRLHGHVEGTGLGLYIVKRIAENSGGKVEVHTAPGEGSNFKVYFRKNLNRV